MQVFDAYDYSNMLSKDLVIYPLDDSHSAGHNISNGKCTRGFSSIDSRLLLLESIKNRNLLFEVTDSLSSMEVKAQISLLIL